MLRIFIVKCVNLLNTNVYLFQLVIKEVIFLFISFTVIFEVLLFLMFLGHYGLCHSLMIVLVLLGFSCLNINPMSILFSQIFVLWFKINLGSISKGLDRIMLRIISIKS
jgi:membrane-bound metal-dependent hydrolase YbcI (DUF457 family)